MKRYIDFFDYKVLFLFVCFAFLSASALAKGKAELIMFEEDGCFYCYRFHKELGSAYKNSQEGQIAPLRTIDLHSALPKDLITKNGNVEFSPTFMLVVDGEEIDRMFGYQGDEFFWVNLQQLFKQLPEEFSYNPDI